MPLTQLGYVYYSDDPHKRVFRVVIPQFDDAELDGAPTDHDGNTYLDGSGKPHTWTNFFVDGARPVAMDKVSRASPPARFAGTVGNTPITEPVVYWLNADTQLAAMSIAQRVALLTSLGFSPSWSNNFVSLGVAATAVQVPGATAGCVSPCHIVIIGGGTPAIGTLSQSGAAVGASTAAVWTA